MTVNTTFEIEALQKIEKIDTVANHFSFELKTELSLMGVVAKIAEFTNEQHNQLHIQLVCKEPHQADKVDMAMIKLAQYYKFEWGYVSDIDRSLVSHIPSRNRVINIDIFDISFLEVSA